VDLDFLLALPWLLLIGALAPIFLLIPLLVELLRRKDRGPRRLPQADVSPASPPAPEPAPEVEAGLGDIDAPGLVRIEGNLEARGSEIHNSMIIKGHIALPAGTAVEGTIKATEYVEVGEAAQVKGDIIAGGDVTIQAGAKVEGIIISRGAVTMGHDAAAAAVISRKGTTLAEGVQVLHRVISGEPIQVVHSEGERVSREEPHAHPSREPPADIPRGADAVTIAPISPAVPPPPAEEARAVPVSAARPAAPRVPSIQVPVRRSTPEVQIPPPPEAEPLSPQATPDSPPRVPVLAMPKMVRRAPAGGSPRPIPSGGRSLSQGKALLRFPEGDLRARKKA
jgi:hypothetical protein